MGDTRILTGFDRKNKGFFLARDKRQINPPCPGAVNHVGRVCYSPPSPFLSGCGPGTGWAKHRECLRQC